MRSWHICYSAPTSPEAHFVKGFLELRGVPVVLENDGPTVVPSAAFGRRVRVLVPEDWLPVARKMVDRRRRAGTRRVLPLRPRRQVR
jgi:Putative prokaryotic signal transducing protein